MPQKRAYQCILRIIPYLIKKLNQKGGFWWGYGHKKEPPLQGEVACKAGGKPLLSHHRFNTPRKTKK
jgi:hypothetical protein